METETKIEKVADVWKVEFKLIVRRGTSEQDVRMELYSMLDRMPEKVAVNMKLEKE